MPRHLRRGVFAAGSVPYSALENHHVIRDVPNTGIAQVAHADVVIAIIDVLDTSGRGAVFVLTGDVHAALKVGGSGAYTVTAGTPTAVNVYWSAGNNRYEIENLFGQTLTFTVFERSAT